MTALPFSPGRFPSRNHPTSNGLFGVSIAHSVVSPIYFIEASTLIFGILIRAGRFMIVFFVTVLLLEFTHLFSMELPESIRGFAEALR